jgi:hypothetical protein
MNAIGVKAGGPAANKASENSLSTPSNLHQLGQGIEHEPAMTMAEAVAVWTQVWDLPTKYSRKISNISSLRPECDGC